MAKTRSPRIYRYVVKTDRGTAPRPFGRLCSLAICKPMIRKHAEPGDWVIGLRSGSPRLVVYAMEITDKLGFAEYWEGFPERRPGAGREFPDNLYRPHGLGFKQEKNDIHTTKHQDTDLSGKFVLLSKRFWYFGREAPAICDELSHLIHRGIGYTYSGANPGDIAGLKKWLGKKSPGVSGEPLNAPDGWAWTEFSELRDKLAAPSRGGATRAKASGSC